MSLVKQFNFDVGYFLTFFVTFFHSHVMFSANPHSFIVKQKRLKCVNYHFLQIFSTSNERLPRTWY